MVYWLLVIIYGFIDHKNKQLSEMKNILSIIA